MSEVRLGARRQGNGFRATVAYSNGVSISSAESFPSIAEAISAAALKLMAMPERLDALNEPTKNDA
jgi:hypothetical protein